MLMKFTKYADGKFMATNATIELDIIVNLDGFGFSYEVQTANDSNTFETWDKAVRFAEHKYGVRNVFSDEDRMYNEMFAMDSDGWGEGQIG
jgi:hypothetical protein